MPDNQKTTPLQRAGELFYLDREAEGCTAATLLWYRRYLGAFVAWLTERGITTAQEMTAELISEYMADVRGRGLARKTEHHYAAAVRAFCNFLVWRQLLTENPARWLKMPKLPKEPLPALTAEEVTKLLAVCNHDRDTALVLFLLDTGLRAAEFVALNVGDVNTETGAVTVHSGKGQKGRVVFVGVRARRALQSYLLSRDDPRPDAPLWVTLWTGERLTHWGLRQVLERLSAAAGVDAHPHKLRRSFAIWALRSGMDIARLAALLGHADLQVVRRYLALVTDDLADAHREHGPVDSLLAKGKGKR